MKRWIVAAGLVLLTAATYAQVPTFDLVLWDDLEYLVDNTHVREGVRGEDVAWALTANYAANWHPLTWWVHMLDFELLGPDPGAHHVAALAWHVLATLLVFQLLSKATGRLGAAAAVAAIFGVHPVHVESVAWISERKDLVSTTFALIAMLAHVAWVRRGGALRWLAIPGCMALSLMAKPTYVSLPLLLLLLDYWPLERPRPVRLVLEKLPLFALSVGSAVVTVFAQSAGGAVVSALPMGDRIANALVSYVRYLGKLAWPAELTVHYPFPGSPGTPAHSSEIVLASLAVLTAITAAVFVSRRRPLIVGWLWFGITLGPMIGLVQVGTQAMAERYAYLALVGPVMMLVFGAGELVGRVSARRGALRAASAVAVGLLVVACAFRTWTHLPSWRDSEALFRNAVSVTPNHPLVQNNLAWLLATHPDPARRRPEEAVALAKRAVETTKGRDPFSLDTLSVALASRGDFGGATREGRRALKAAKTKAPELVSSVRANLVSFEARRAVRDPNYLRLARRPAAARPNVLLISIDTLNSAALPPSAAGSRSLPNLAALMKAGHRFTRAVSPASWTLPAHASMLTGVYPDAHGLTAPKAGLYPDVPNPVEGLRAAGYHTLGFTDGGFVDAEFGLGRGFDRYDDPAPPGMEASRAGSEAANAAGPFARAVSYLASRKPDDPPFFLFVHTYFVHDYFLNAEGIEPGTHERCLLGVQHCDAAAWARLEDLYRSRVETIDGELGELLAVIERRGERDRTLVILTSDHGEGFAPDRGRIHHGGRLHADVLDVPLVWSGPGVVPGQTKLPVSLVDLMPTVLEHVGVPIPAGVEGTSLAPRLQGGAAPKARPLFALEYYYVWRDGRRFFAEDLRPAPLALGVMAGRWWYLRDADGEQLYDMRADAAQRNDLAALGRHEELRRRLVDRHLRPQMQRRAARDAAVEPRTPSDALLERLRALGYAE